MRSKPSLTSGSRRKPARSELATPRILAALSGSRTELRQLYDRYAPLVRAAVARKASAVGRSDIDDLYQEVWCRLLDLERSPLRRFDPEMGVFSQILWLMVRQQTHRVLVAERRRIDTVALGDAMESNEHGDPEERFVSNVLARRLVRHARHSLPKPDFVVLARHIREGVSLMTLARDLGSTVSTLQKRHQRLMPKLRRLLETLPGCVRCRDTHGDDPFALAA